MVFCCKCMCFLFLINLLLSCFLASVDCSGRADVLAPISSLLEGGHVERTTFRRDPPRPSLPAQIVKHSIPPETHSGQRIPTGRLLDTSAKELSSSVRTAKLCHFIDRAMAEASMTWTRRNFPWIYKQESICIRQWLLRCCPRLACAAASCFIIADLCCASALPW